MADNDMRQALDFLANDDRVLALGALLGLDLAATVGVYCMLQDNNCLVPATRWVAYVGDRLVVWPKAPP